MGLIKQTITDIKSESIYFGVIMLSNLTFADCFRPAQKRLAFAYEAILILGSSLLIAISAQVAFGWPVPVTGQTFAILLLAASLGSRRAVLAVLAYICEGLAGLPVFAQCKAGLPVLLGPTGGYIIGFLVAAYLVGSLAERGWSRKIVTMVAAMVLGNVVIYTFGLSWLAFVIRGVGIQKILAVGLYPFIPGEFIKVALAAWLLPTGWKIISAVDNKK
jgi:biotin transport system substrate-specific component